MTAKIEGLEQIEAVTGLRDFRSFRLVSSLSLIRDDLDLPFPSYGLTLGLDTEGPGPVFRLILGFGKVTNLRIGEWGGGYIQIMGLIVIDISDRQWEGARLEVRDEEAEAIRFLCWNAKVLEVSRID